MATSLFNRSVQWEWEGDRGVWQQYPLDIQQEISKAFEKGDKEVAINQTEEITMIIKFPTMTQINQKTKFLRRIRLCIEFSDRNGFYVFEYQNEQQKWLVYNVEIMLEIAKAIDNDEDLISIDSNNQSYEIDLKKSIETKSNRKIHRIKSSLYLRKIFDL